jgi:non-heme chloroperoxidase
MPFVTTRDNQSLHVRIIGRGQPVLMLHGMGMHGAHWLPFVLPYIRRFRFYLPDMRGAGRSSHVRINQPDIFQNHCEDMQDVITHFGLNDYLLAGYSLGGSTALHLQREGGFDGVRRYLHIDQSPCVGNREDWRFGLFGEQQADVFSALERLLRLLDQHADTDTLGNLPPDVRKQVIDILADVFSRLLGRRAIGPLLQLSAHWPWLLSRLFPFQHVHDIRAYIGSYISGGHDYRESLPHCPAPVTVLVGMKSPLYAPAGQMAIADHAPRGRVVALEKSGHVPLMDEPVRFMRELGRFLQGR